MAAAGRWPRAASALIPDTPSESLPGPDKYVTQGSFGLFLVALGDYFTYFWGPGRTTWGCSWDLVTAYCWACDPTYSLPNWPCIGYPNHKFGYKPSHS